MKLKTLLLVSAFFCFSGCVTLLQEDDNHRIAQIKDYYPIRYNEHNNTATTDKTANILALNITNKCNSSYVEISPDSLGITKQAFDSLWVELKRGGPQGKKIYF